MALLVTPTLRRGLEKQKLEEQIAALRTQEDESSELPELENELVRVEAESIAAEVQLSAITHEKIKFGFAYQFEAMREFGEKLSIIAGYGKHLLELIEDVPATAGVERSEYGSHEASAAYVVFRLYICG